MEPAGERSHSFSNNQELNEQFCRIPKNIINRSKDRNLFVRSSNHNLSNLTFLVGWWNGGGAIRRSLRTNKELSDFLKCKPDFFFMVMQDLLQNGFISDRVSNFASPRSNSKTFFLQEGVGNFLFGKALGNSFPRLC